MTHNLMSYETGSYIAPNKSQTTIIPAFKTRNTRKRLREHRTPRFALDCQTPSDNVRKRTNTELFEINTAINNVSYCVWRSQRALLNKRFAKNEDGKDTNHPATHAQSDFRIQRAALRRRGRRLAYRQEIVSDLLERHANQHICFFPLFFSLGNFKT